MGFVKSLFMRAFGRPTGLLGRLGGMIMARTNRRIARRAIDLLDVQPDDRVLEIGFGPGVGIDHLAGSASSGWIAGVDPSEEMVEQAKARNAAAIGAGRVELRRASVGSLPFESGTFDKALAINSMQVWSDAVVGLREIRRVLKPGDRVVLALTRHSGQAKEGLAETLTAAGLPARTWRTTWKRGISVRSRSNLDRPTNGDREQPRLDFRDSNRGAGI